MMKDLGDPLLFSQQNPVKNTSLGGNSSSVCVFLTESLTASPDLFDSQPTDAMMLSDASKGAGSSSWISTVDTGKSWCTDCRKKRQHSTCLEARSTGMFYQWASSMLIHSSVPWSNILKPNGTSKRLPWASNLRPRKSKKHQVTQIVKPL